MKFMLVIFEKKEFAEDELIIDEPENAVFSELWMILKSFYNFVQWKGWRGTGKLNNGF